MVIRMDRIDLVDRIRMAQLTFDGDLVSIDSCIH